MKIASYISSSIWYPIYIKEKSTGNVGNLLKPHLNEIIRSKKTRKKNKNLLDNILKKRS